jgi:hypothetical protein
VQKGESVSVGEGMGEGACVNEGEQPGAGISKGSSKGTGDGGADEQKEREVGGQVGE